jgi:transformer-2 protein
VTGLSSRVTERDLEEHFSKEGKVSITLIFYLFSLNNHQFPSVVIPKSLTAVMGCLHYQVASCFLVVEPRTRISRGFAFVTMDSVEDANRCIKYLNQSVLEGRYITVERVMCFLIN